MKKKLSEAIKAKFVGIDDNTAMRLAERIIRKGEPITTDDEVNAAVEAITLTDVLKSVSDFSADDATKKYEAKYGLKDGAPIKKEEPQKPEPKPDEEKGKADGEKDKDPAAIAEAIVSKMMAQFNSKFDAMGADIAAIKAGKITETRKNRLAGVIKDLRESQKKAYGRISVDKMSDEEFEDLLAEVQSEVNDIVAENKANGSVVSTPLGGRHEVSGNGKEASKDELDALVGKFNLPNA